MDTNKLVTLTVQSADRAQLLKAALEAEGISSKFINLKLLQPLLAYGVRIRVYQNDLPKALKIMESMQVMSEPAKSKKILVPVDFSEQSMINCEIAFRIAQRIAAEVVLIHAYDVPDNSFILSRDANIQKLYSFSETERIRKETIQQNAEKFKTFVSTLKNRINKGEIPNIKYITLVENGVPEDVIIYASQKYDTQLIVMSIKNCSVEDAAYVGSVTAEVMERALVPVLILPEGVDAKHFFSTQKLLYSTSLERNISTPFEKVMTILSGIINSVVFFHFQENTDAWNEIKLAGLKDYFQRKYTSITMDSVMMQQEATDDEYQKIQKFEHFVVENDIDIAVLNIHRRNMFFSLFNPSMARKLLFQSNIPLLVVRN